jgi:hypothetical protein
MNAAVQNGFPLDLLGILAAGEHLERLATTGARPLFLGEIVNRFLRRKVATTSSAIALRTWLFASSASWLAARLGHICSVGVVIHGGSRMVLVGLRLGALLGLSPEDLPLEPSDPRQRFLKLAGQLGDLGLLLANDLLEALSLVLPSCFPLGSTSMQRPPVVCLLAEFDLPATDFGILNEHAGMVRTPALCVQPPQQNSRSAPETATGSLNVYATKSGWVFVSLCL